MCDGAFWLADGFSPLESARRVRFGTQVPRMMSCVKSIGHLVEPLMFQADRSETTFRKSTRQESVPEISTEVRLPRLRKPRLMSPQS